MVSDFEGSNRQRDTKGEEQRNHAKIDPAPKQIWGTRGELRIHSIVRVIQGFDWNLLQRSNVRPNESSPDRAPEGSTNRDTLRNRPRQSSVLSVYHEGVYWSNTKGAA